VAGSCEHGTESSGSIKDGKFVGQLGDYRLLRIDSALFSYGIPYDPSPKYNHGNNAVFRIGVAMKYLSSTVRQVVEHFVLENIII
jgi:hypothetical protein